MNYFILFYFIILLVDPSGLILHMKIPLTGLVFILILFKIKKIKYSKDLVLYMSLLILIQLISLTIGELYFVNPDYQNYQRIGTIIFFILVSFMLQIIGYNIVIIFIVSINFLALFGIGSFIFFMLYPDLFMLYYPQFKDILHISYRELGGIKYSAIYLGTSEILIFNLYYYLFKEKASFADNTLFLINMIALILSGTRVNIFVAMVIFLLYLYKKYKLMLLVLSGIILPFIFSDILPFLNSAVSLSNQSNSKKIGYFDTYSIYFDKIKYLFFGQGIQNPFNNEQFTTELVYMEIFRMYGLLFGMVMMILLLLPLFQIKKIDKGNKFIYLSYLTYLIMNLVNPSLFTSQGMILYAIMVYCFLYLHKNKNYHYSLTRRTKTNILKKGYIYEN